MDDTRNDRSVYRPMPYDKLQGVAKTNFNDAATGRSAQEAGTENQSRTERAPQPRATHEMPGPDGHRVRQQVREHQNIEASRNLKPPQPQLSDQQKQEILDRAERMRAEDRSRQTGRDDRQR